MVSPWFGTIGHKKKSLNKLMHTINGVCNGDIIPNPILPKYSSEIEDVIATISNSISEIIPSDKNYLTRWVSIKLLDNDKKIIDSIDCNIFSNNLKKNNKMNALISESLKTLKSKGLENDQLKDYIVSSILESCELISKEVCKYEKSTYNSRDRKIDSILTSKIFGLPIMILFLAIIFWLTIVGSNFPSELLANFFDYVQKYLTCFLEYINLPSWLVSLLIDGVYDTVTWVISVMLPPMAIFFPLFTLMEDLGYLPRISFNLDKYFRKACSSRKASFNNVYAGLVVMHVALQVQEL